MAVQWYCRMMGTELGPYTAAQLIDLARQSRLTPEDWVRKGADGQWVSADRVHGLFEAARRPPATPSAPVAAPPDKAGGSDTKLPTRQHYEELVSTVAAQPGERQRVDVEWFCICHGEKLGPLSFFELKQLAATGQLDPRARVWSNAAPKWCRAEDVPGLIR